MSELEKRAFDNPIRTIHILIVCFENAMRALYPETQKHLYDALMETVDQILDLPSCGLSIHDQSIVRALLTDLEDPRPPPPRLTVVSSSN